MQTARPRLLAAVAVAAAAALAAGCGDDAAGGGGTAEGGGAAPVASSGPAVLPAGAVPGLSGPRRAVTPRTLVLDGFAGAGLPARLRRWGYVAGAERELRGNAGGLTHVVARSLRFETAGGARAYVAFLRQNAGDMVGDPPRVRRLARGGGLLVTAPPCGCHRETPLLVAVRRRGAGVASVLVNGPEASPAAARRLVALIP